MLLEILFNEEFILFTQKEKIKTNTNTSTKSITKSTTKYVVEKEGKEPFCVN